MRQGVFLFFFCLLLGSCNNKEVDSDILPATKMQLILSDLMKADQFISDFRVPNDTIMDRDVESIKLYQRVFALHDITKVQFDRSLAYYQSRPDLLKVIMDSISKPVIVAPVQTTPPVDSTLKKDSLLLRKDSTNLTKDSINFRKKKLLLQNN